MRVVLLFSDPSVGEIISTSLQADGFDAELATDQKEVRTLIGHKPADVIVIDWHLPELTGIEMCALLGGAQGQCQAPILILGNPKQVWDHICCPPKTTWHEMGKPYAISALARRIRQLAANTSDGGEMRAGTLVLNSRSRSVTHGLRRLHLGPKEFRLLEIFLQNPDCVISRDKLVAAVWGRAGLVHHRTVDVHVGRLRRALMRGNNPNPIRTVRGYGYVFDCSSVA